MVLQVFENVFVFIVFLGNVGLEGLGFFCLPGLVFGGKNDLKKGINFCKCLFPFLFFIDLNNFLNKCFF
jgi:hypothetical protein